MVNINIAPRLSRRAALGLAAGAVGSLALGACSNEGRGAPTGGGNGGAGTGGLEMPTSVPLPDIEGVTLSEVEGVPPAYTSLPYPGVSSVKETPGHGGELRAFTITWGAPPKLASEGGQWHQAINKALNVDLQPMIVPAQTFGDKLVTTIAGGDIPEITTNEPSYRGRSARKYLPQGVFHDLREFLGGDKVLKYPNLSMVPSFAWENSKIGEALYGVPCYRNQTVGGTLGFRADWAAKGGFEGKPTNQDELTAWLKAIKKGGPDGTYVTATLDQTFNACGLAVQKTCNNWKVDGGKLIKDLETDEYEAGLAYAAQMWKDGLVHPNMVALTPNAAEIKAQFIAGRVGITNDNLDGYFGTGGQRARLLEREPDAEFDLLVPPGHDGGLGTVGPDLGYYCMLSIPSSITDEARIDEILRVIDYLAAPMGSTEWFLVHNGVEGHNYTVEDGNIVPTNDDEIKRESFLSMLSGFSQGFYFPGAPADDALACQKAAEEMVPAFVADPTVGLDSETSFSKGDALSALMRDYETAIVTGRKKVSEIAELRTRWRNSGGDEIRAELEEQL